MRQVDERHGQERALLVDLLSKATEDEELILIAQGSSELERQDKLEELKDHRLAFGLGNQAQRLGIRISFFWFCSPNVWMFIEVFSFLCQSVWSLFLILESTIDNHKILQGACVTKVESRRMTLTYESGEVQEGATDAEVHVSLLADLQEQQDRDAEELLQAILDKVKTCICL